MVGSTLPIATPTVEDQASQEARSDAEGIEHIGLRQDRKQPAKQPSDTKPDEKTKKRPGAGTEQVEHDCLYLTKSGLTFELSRVRRPQAAARRLE